MRVVIRRPLAKRRDVARLRLALAYTLLGTLTAGVAIILFFFASRDSAANDAHINLATGSTNGIEPDDRLGTMPPQVAMGNLDTASSTAGCALHFSLVDEGHKHLSWSDPRPHYLTKPPTSGDHIETPYQQADGAYLRSPPQVAVVHSLEHGRLAIEYDPALPESSQLELIGLFDTMFGGTLIFPNSKMPYQVAAVTWTNLLGCRDYRGNATLDAIRDFGKRTWGRFGGEPVNGFALTGPTP